MGATKNAPLMEEDCLFLNVYTPTTDSGQAQKFPVMFYIHDGQFEHGSGNDFPGKFKGPLILLCWIISVEYPTNFEFGATFSIEIYTLNWFWFVFDLVWYAHQ